MQVQETRLVAWVNKPMPSLDPQWPQQGMLANTPAGIQAFVEANMLETHFKLGDFFFSILHTIITANPESF